MTHVTDIGLLLAESCRSLLEMGITLLLQSTLLLLVGLLAGRLLLRQGPAIQSLVYRATLVGVLVGATLSAAHAPSIRP